MTSSFMLPGAAIKINEHLKRLLDSLVRKLLK